LIKSIVFVVGQYGSAAYLAPLFERWLTNGNSPCEWKVSAAGGAIKKLDDMGLDEERQLTWTEDSAIEFPKGSDQWSPDLFVISASYHPMEEAYVKYACEHSVPIIRFIDTWYDYGPRLKPVEGVHCAYDHVLVIDYAAVEEAISEGIAAEVLHAVGHPAWENVLMLPKEDQRNVMFVSQPIHYFYGDSLGYTEETAWNSFFETAKRHPELVRKIIFAPHPNDAMPMPQEDEMVTVMHGQKAMGDVGVVVGMFSSLLVDALLAGRKVISYQPGAVSHSKCHLGREQLIPHAHTEKELITALKEPCLTSHDISTSLVESCDRLEAFLLEMLNG